MDERSRKLVVAALVVNARGEVLLTRRRADQDHPLLWEFPGGKVEPGEAPGPALARELREELGVNATIDAIWDVLFHAYPRYDVYMLVYRARFEGEARPVEVGEVAWVPVARLADYAILPADAPLIERLIKEA